MSLSNRTCEAVLSRLAEATVVIKAAAVSDYRVAQPADAKTPKGEAPLTLELVPTPDILKEVGTQKGARIVVGFAAETGEIVQRAHHKLMAKQLDLIVANDVSQAGAGFACDINLMILIDPADRVEDLPLLPKRQVARHILDRVVSLRPQSGWTLYSYPFWLDRSY